MRLFAALSLLVNRDQPALRPYLGALVYVASAMGATFAIGAGVYFGGVADDLWIAYPFLSIWSAIFFAYLFLLPRTRAGARALRAGGRSGVGGAR